MNLHFLPLVSSENFLFVNFFIYLFIILKKSQQFISVEFNEVFMKMIGFLRSRRGKKKDKKRKKKEGSGSGKDDKSDG